MAIQKEIWARAILEAFFADNSFASKAVNDDMYVNEGKKVHIPNAGAPSKVVINRSTVPATAAKRTDVDVEYSLDEFTTDPIYIPHADRVELSYDKRNSAIRQDKSALIEAASQNLLYKWDPTSTNFVRTTGDAAAAHTTDATGNRKKLITADILSLMTKFDQDNIPSEGRYLLLDAVMYGQLLDSMTNTDKIGFFQAADIKKGVMGQLYSFNVMKRSQVLRYTTAGVLSKFDTAGVATDNAAGLAWHEESVSRAIGEVKVFERNDDPLYYGDILSFLVRCGGAIRRKDKKGIYAIVQDTAPTA